MHMHYAQDDDEEEEQKNIAFVINKFFSPHTFCRPHSHSYVSVASSDTVVLLLAINQRPNGTRCHHTYHVAATTRQ